MLFRKDYWHCLLDSQFRCLSRYLEVAKIHEVMDITKIKSKLFIKLRIRKGQKEWRFSYGANETPILLSQVLEQEPHRKRPSKLPSIVGYYGNLTWNVYNSSLFPGLHRILLLKHNISFPIRAMGTKECKDPAKAYSFSMLIKVIENRDWWLPFLRFRLG